MMASTNNDDDDMDVAVDDAITEPINVDSIKDDVPVESSTESTKVSSHQITAPYKVHC
jgi:hypothetical protein